MPLNIPLINQGGGGYNVSPSGGGALSSVLKIGGDLPAIGGIVRSLANVGSAIGIKAKSPRYGGGDGPLYSTVNKFIARIQSGEMAVIDQLNQLRQSDVDKVQWQLFWSTDMLKTPMTPEQKARVVQLDSSQAGKFVTMQTPQTSGGFYPLAQFGDPAALAAQAQAAGTATPGNYVVLGFMVLAALLLVRK